MKKIGIVGSGLMGSGIAEVSSQAGFDVVVFDSSEAQLEKARQRIEKDMKRLTDKGKITAETGSAVLARVTYSTDIQILADASIVVEAVYENLAVKKDIFRQVEAVVTPEAILLSNTSALAISAIFSGLEKPGRAMGMHFFHPVPVMKLVELIPGSYTSAETLTAAREWSEAIGKVPVLAKEYPGFIVNRILVPMMNEAAFLVMEGVDPKDVDQAMKLGANLPMGPLELADFVGIDIMVATMRGLYEGFMDSKYRPCPLLVNMVSAGLLGRKSGRGFYTYE